MNKERDEKWVSIAYLNPHSASILLGLYVISKLISNCSNTIVVI